MQQSRQQSLTRCQATGKFSYATPAAADTALVQARREYKANGRDGKSWKRLNVYRCPDCQRWHIGRSSKPPVKPAPPENAQRVPSTGELRRRLARIERQMDRNHAYRVKLLSEIVAADKAMLALQEEMRQEQLQITAMFLGPPRDKQV